MKKFLVAKTLFLLVGLFFACSTKPVSVEGMAMKPAFNDGDKILVDKNFSNLKRGDVITFLYPKDRSKWYFKRIVGLPNETIEIREGKVYINGELLDEPYVDESNNHSKSNFPPIRVPEFHYFVIGDNRDNSSDSRYWGTLDRELITGRYYMTYSKSKE